MNGQRGFCRGELKQLLSQLHWWIGLAAGVAHKDRYAWALLAFGPLVRRDALHHHAPIELAGLAAHRHPFGHAQARDLGVHQRITDQALQLAVVVGVVGFQHATGHLQAVLQIENAGRCGIGFDHHPVLVKNDHANH
ncbi:hypothetical protein SDC9_204236 [bioreactor metagenome]|uniref:Uncharacterized protein n=1 Tax=bioreactor metagenome TaxID=1076179 RepID=A0A645IZB7_9ZZZZ